ncbi:MAG: hypothetical protein JJ899_04390 [Alphaproteobacteria bacterium]|nr:hypothetical protein [Alphaproteobacteria bacterium]
MKFNLDRRGLLTGMSAVALAACTNPPPSPRFPQLTFTHVPAFRLDAATLDIADAYRPAAGARDVAQGMPIPPAVAAQRWARDRLQPVGTAGRILFTVTDASVVEVPLQRTSGLRGVVTDDQSERYDGRLAARIEISDGRGRRGEVSAEATRSRTIAEKSTLNERDKIWFEITEALIQDLDKELDTAIRRFLQPFLRP